MKLERIAADGGSIAELNACKALLALPEFQDVDSADSDPFEALDAGNELAQARQKRSQAA